MARRILLLATALLIAHPSSAQQQRKITYQDNVRPILREHCLACHNQDDPNSGLALDSFEGAVAGGASGEVLVPGDPAGSRLWQLITHQQEPSMPPGDKLPEKQLLVLQRWIEGGLLDSATSKPLQSDSPGLESIAVDPIATPAGQPVMPADLFPQPVVWSLRVGPVDALATSPWAPLVAIAWQRQVTFYHAASHEVLGILPYLEGVPRVVRFSRDGSILLVAGGRHAVAGSASLYDVKTGARLTTVGDELDIVLAADVSPDLSLVAIGGPKKKVRVYRSGDGSLAYEMGKHTDWITALAFSPDGKLLATADRSAGVRLWQAAAGYERADLRGHSQAISSLAWRPDAGVLATASEDGSVRLWSPEGRQIKSINAHSGGTRSVRFAANGDFVTTGRDRKVKTWKSDGAPLAELGTMPDAALAADFTFDGTSVVASDYSGEIRLIDRESKNLLTRLAANPQRLADRLAELDNAFRAMEEEIRAGENEVQNTLAALNEGRAAHTALESQLAEGRTSLEKDRLQLEQSLARRDEQQQLLAEAQQAAQQAEEVLQAATESLAKADDTDADAAAEPQDAAHQQAIAAHDLAIENLAAAGQALEVAKAELAAAETNVQESQESLVELRQRAERLPDLSALDSTHQLAAGGLEELKQQLAEIAAERAELAQLQESYERAPARLASEHRKSQEQRDALAAQLSASQTKYEQAAAELSSRQAESARVEEQLKALQARLAELVAAERQAAVKAEGEAAQLAELQEELAEAERVARLADTRRQDFLAAEELRQTHAEKR